MSHAERIQIFCAILDAFQKHSSVLLIKDAFDGCPLAFRYLKAFQVSAAEDRNAYGARAYAYKKSLRVDGALMPLLPIMISTKQFKSFTRILWRRDRVEV